MWLVFAAACALLYAAEGAWAKKLARDGWSPAFLAFGAVALMTPALWLAALADGGVTLRSGFWPACLLSVAANTAALTLYYKALAAGELSVVFPLLALTPVWMLVSSQAIAGEFPSAWGLAGVALVTVGCYLLRSDGEGALAPLRKLWIDRGSRCALAAGALWSLSANLDKAAVLASSRFGYPAVHAPLLALTLWPLAWREGRADFAKLRGADARRDLVLLAAIGLGIVLTQFVAIALTQATYVIAVKRAGIVPGVLIGWKVYSEPDGPRRLALSLVVAGGVALLAFA